MSERRPTRATVDGRVYLDLQNLAKRQARRTDELIQLYALEGFLARLSASEFAHQFALKGGVLLAAFGSRRPTRDVDLFARDLSNDVEAILARVRVICSLPVEDGLHIDPASAKAQTIRDDHEYAGVRVMLSGSLSVARVAFHVDINVGDPVWPEPGLVDMPKLLGGTMQVIGYPLPMVFAEKIVTMLERLEGNTRWRDFTDIYTLSNSHAVDGRDLRRSLTIVAAARDLAMEPLASTLAALPELAQPKWSAWRRKQQLLDRVPEQFSEVLDRVCEFADPVLSGVAEGTVWEPSTRSWN